jgi:hypothetical protein
MSLPNDIWTHVLGYAIKDIKHVIEWQTVSKWFFAATRVHGSIDVGTRIIMDLPKNHLSILPRLFNISKMRQYRDVPIPGSAVTLHMSFADVAINFTTMTTLRHLRVKHSSISTLPQNLLSLRASNVGMSLVNLSQLTSLTKLKILRCDGVNNAHLTLLTQLVYLSNTETVDLPHMPNLHTLRLYSCVTNITGWSITRLNIVHELSSQTLMSLKNLRDFTVYGHNYQLSTINALPLITLRLSNTNNHYSTFDIPTLRNLKTLRSHVIVPSYVTSLCVIQGDFVPELPTSLLKLKLCCINASYNVNHITVLTALTQLDVRRSPISFDTNSIKKIQSAIPQLQITR